MPSWRRWWPCCRQPARFAPTSWTTTVVPPGAGNIHARFLSGADLPAELVATDPDLELSVIKVARPPAGVRAVPVRRSAGVRVGEAAFSYGDAFDTFETSGKFTAGLGIVSGIYELTKQLRGEAESRQRQVPLENYVALAHNVGGTGHYCYVTILRR